MRTTASRSAREENRQPMSTGVRVQPREAQNRSTSDGGGRCGKPRRNQAPKVEREGSLSTTSAVPPRRSTRASSGSPGSQPGPKK